MHMNVYEMAMHKELEVKAYYEKLAGETSLAGIRTIFTLLAGDEQKHYDAVLCMKTSADPRLPADSAALETAKDLILKYIGDTDVASKLKNDVDGYRYALSIEAESVKFYESMLEKETDGRLKRIIAGIIAQEKNHYNIVENLYDFALKPEYFLAWGEFSNLKEL
jgi:rubrerythrin